LESVAIAVKLLLQQFPYHAIIVVTTFSSHGHKKYLQSWMPAYRRPSRHSSGWHVSLAKLAHRADAGTCARAGEGACAGGSRGQERSGNKSAEERAIAKAAVKELAESKAASARRQKSSETGRLVPSPRPAKSSTGAVGCGRVSNNWSKLTAEAEWIKQFGFDWTEEAHSAIAGRLASGSPTLAAELLLPSIAAVVVGGTAITGGVGSIWRTLVGALIISVVRIGMTFLGVNIFDQNIVFGAVLIGAIAVTIDRSKIPVVKWHLEIVKVAFVSVADLEWPHRLSFEVPNRRIAPHDPLVRLQESRRHPR
jgi:hypothetical protein